MKRRSATALVFWIRYYCPHIPYTMQHGVFIEKQSVLCYYLTYLVQAITGATVIDSVISPNARTGRASLNVLGIGYATGM
jgi:hypothetical protein